LRMRILLGMVFSSIYFKIQKDLLATHSYAKLCVAKRSCFHVVALPPAALAA